jgi:hypothetical protein
MLFHEDHGRTKNLGGVVEEFDGIRFEVPTPKRSVALPSATARALHDRLVAEFDHERPVHRVLITAK